MNPFPIENLPFGVLYPGRIGVAFGDRILDLQRATGGLPAETREACAEDSLNALMSLRKAHRLELRAHLTELLRGPHAGAWLLPMEDAVMMTPARIGDYTDFYASIHHATNVGRRFRPESPLLPNYKWVPIAYHGRASSIVVSGTPVDRPSGQTRDAAADAPRFGPSRSLDYELEVGYFIGPGNAQGQPIPIAAASHHLFGVCLVNDWSARDIQAWEYQPLGPFLGKSFATSVSPWVVTMEALEPYRVPVEPRLETLPYLRLADDWAIDVTLEVELSTAMMRAQSMAPVRVSRGRLGDLYWTPSQMVAHHTSNGCNLRAGDLLATGTVSGASPESVGCLLERTSPIGLPTGETRTFLEDGDEVTLSGYCGREGLATICLGECTGRVMG
jgi:fumarylacetoacetase